MNVFNPQTQQRESVVKTQVRLFGSYRENRFLSPQYVAELERVKDANKRKAWLEGDWNIVAGGAIDDLWDEVVHVVPRFQVPTGWRIDRSFDWGSSKPFSVGWWALSNGEEATLPDGRVFCPLKGSLVRIAEWYGGNPNESNVGLCLSAKSIAEGVKFVEDRLNSLKWVQSPIYPGPADNSIFNETRNDRNELDSIARSMEKEGITWESSNKSPGSRKMGLQLVRDRLEASLDREGAGLYFMDHCRQAITQLPVLPRDPEDPDDVDTEAEDHLWDELRYRVLKGAGFAATSIPVTHAT